MHAIMYWRSHSSLLSGKIEGSQIRVLEDSLCAVVYCFVILQQQKNMNNVCTTPQGSLGGLDLGGAGVMSVTGRQDLIYLSSGHRLSN